MSYETKQKSYKTKLCQVIENWGVMKNFIEHVLWNENKKTTPQFDKSYLIYIPVSDSLHIFLHRYVE